MMQERAAPNYYYPQYGVTRSSHSSRDNNERVTIVSAPHGIYTYMKAYAYLGITRNIKHQTRYRVGSTKEIVIALSI